MFNGVLKPPWICQSKLGFNKEISTVSITLSYWGVKETIKFYEEKLEFQKILSVPEEGEILNFAILNKDKISIMIQQQKNLLEEYSTLKTDEIVPTFTLFITVNDVLAIYNELKDKVEIAKELHKTFYDKSEFAIFDNNGNILTISC